VSKAMWTTVAAIAIVACSRAPEPEAPPRAVLVKRVGQGTTGRLTVLSGEVRARHETDLAFQVGGKLLERRVDVGALVKRGQVLARLDPQDVNQAAAAARAAVVAAESDLAWARVELERARELRGKNFISASVLDERTAGFRAADARLDQARAQARVAGNQAGYATLVADADGVVTAALAEPGQVLGAGQAALRVARQGEREILVYLPESRRREVAVGAVAEVRPWAESTRSYPARVREVAPAADATTRTYAVRVAVPGADEALPLGATAVALFAGQAPEPESGASPAGPFLLPLPAVTRQGETASVWVVDGDRRDAGTVQPRPVEVAAYREDGVLVKRGLAAGDRVVVAGVHTLVPGQTVRVVDEAAPVALDVAR
jgi:multidrug efflux system membrane fusion protein